MGLISKLASKDTSKIVIIPSDSKDVSIKSEEQFLNILNNKYRLNGIKGSTKIKIYNRYSDINHVFTTSKVTAMLITEL